MPFTLAHAAAAVPLRRLHLIPSALVIGTMAPDFEYFIYLAPADKFGHTLRGVFLLSLPLALLALWLFQRFVKVPVIMLLPDRIRLRLRNYSRPFPFWGAGRLLMISGSILVGIATHVIWDSFTHPTGWLYDHWAFLARPVRLPLRGVVPCYKLLQHGSTVLGMLVLCAWSAHWYWTTKPRDRARVRGRWFSSGRKVAIVTVVACVAIAGALVRAVAGMTTVGRPALQEFVAQAVVTVMALVWWQLVAYGVYETRNSASHA